MIKNNINKRKGITLVELILAMSLVSIIITLSASMIILANKSHKVTIDEYELQSTIRLATEKTNKILRYSSAIFTIPKGRFFEANLTDGWSYFGISPDGYEIIAYIYEQRTNSSGVLELKHWKEVVVPKRDNIKYEFVFEKNTGVANDRVIKYSIIAKTVDTNSEKIDVDSEVEVLNALQVVDRGTAVTPAVAIAYRSDARPQGEVVGNITMVLDVSGSMAYRLNGTQNSVPESEKRITKLKSALNTMINEFSKEEYVEISIVPFSTSANYPNTTDESSKDEPPFYKVSNPTKKTALLGKVDGLTANGGTNTGDGMRRAYYRNKYFTDNIHNTAIMPDYGPGFSTREYMIILVDGVTTQATSIGGSGDSKYKTNEGYQSNLTWYSYSGQWNNAGIIGKGNDEDPVTDRYVEIIGQKIKDRNIKVYVIGFSSLTAELNSVNKIATAAGALNKDVYKFTDALDLNDVFAEIKADIMKDLWHIRGPKL